MLKGRLASLELTGEPKVTGAKNVSVGADFTTWRAQGDEQPVPTSDVVRITVEPKRRILKVLGWGLVGGVGLGLLGVAGSSDAGTLLDPLADATFFAGSVVAGAVVGTIVDAATGKAPARVVFEAPVERYVEPSTQGSRDPERAAAVEHLKSLVWRTAANQSYLDSFRK